MVRRILRQKKKTASRREGYRGTYKVFADHSINAQKTEI
jgi:hypothetical protein